MSETVGYETYPHLWKSFGAWSARAVLFIERCMHVAAYNYVRTGLHKPLCLCAEILAGYEDSSP